MGDWYGGCAAFWLCGYRYTRDACCRCVGVLSWPEIALYLSGLFFSFEATTYLN